MVSFKVFRDRSSQAEVTQEDWVENEMNNKKEIIADLRERIQRENEISNNFRQVIESEN